MRKNNQTGRILIKCGADKKVNNFLWRTTQMCRYFLTTYTNKAHEDKNIKQMSCYTQETGRSMVEMLGVLAIIGVLSVGAIAGYQKAMMKYKLNKHAQAITMLINNALQIKDSLPKPKNDTMYYADVFNKLKLLPDGIKYQNGSNVKDKYFNILMSIYQTNTGTQDFGGIGFNFGEKANAMADVCRNIVFAAKENAENLWLLELGSAVGGNTTYFGEHYGNKYCDNKSKKCLSALTLIDTESLCNSCQQDAASCTFYVLWK